MLAGLKVLFAMVKVFGAELGSVELFLHPTYAKSSQIENTIVA